MQTYLEFFLLGISAHYSQKRKGKRRRRRKKKKKKADLLPMSGTPKLDKVHVRMYT